MTTPYHHKTIESLIKQGLVERDGEEIKVTPAGDEYTRALIAQYPNIKKARKCSSKTVSKTTPT
jgi:predicted methyltransferase